jgi:hypothetical protein
MSIVAILNESIPHILAALMTHVLATAWSVYQIFNTASFQSEFARSTIRSGQCGGVNLLPNYWTERRGAEIAVLIVNCVSLVATGVMSWRLVKVSIIGTRGICFLIALSRPLDGRPSSVLELLSRSTASTRSSLLSLSLFN